MADHRPGAGAVFLDRDGVLNRAVVRRGRPHPPASAAELEMLPGAVDACEMLRAAGFILVVVTNQPDVARGTQSQVEVEALNHEVRRHVPLDGVYVCPHDDGDRCPCRKPRPGLLVAAADDHGIDLTASFMVGDRWRDIDAGRAAGCRTAFIDYGYDERRPRWADVVVGDLSEAAHWICLMQSEPREELRAGL